MAKTLTKKQREALRMKFGGRCAWNHIPPFGEGWFVGSIHVEHEEGPICFWLRHKGSECNVA